MLLEDGIGPSALVSVGLLLSVVSYAAAAPVAIVVHLHCLFGKLESSADSLALEDVPVEILAEKLSGLIIDEILRVDHDNNFGPELMKGHSDLFRVAGIDKDHVRQLVHLVLEYSLDVLRLDVVDEPQVVD